MNAETQSADQDLAGYYIVADELNMGTQSADLFTHRPDSDEFIQTSVHGGAGDDLFLLNITDQMHVHDSEILGQAGDDAIYAMGELYFRTGVFTASEDDPELVRVSTAVIEDFEPGVDKVEVDLERLTIGYNAAAARLFEDSTTGSTTLVITLTDDDAENHFPTQEIVVDVRATGLTWDDVDFVANEETPIVLVQLAT